jgi:drug/metabolite transporter (DMT)-like permease
VAVLLWLGATQGASYLFIRVAVRELSPAVLMEARLLIGAAPVCAYFVLRGRGQELLGAWRVGLVLGVLNAAGPYILIAWGEQHVDSGVAAVANAAVPIFVALVAIKMLPGERVTGLRLAGVFVGLAGVGVLSGLNFDGGSLALWGTLAVVIAALLFAVAQLYVQKHIEIGGSVLATIGMVAGALLLLPFSLAAMPAHLPSSETIASTLALALVSTCLAQVIFYWMLTWHGASRASLVTYSTPVFTLAFGAWFLGEPATAAKLGGLALIVVGVAVGAGLTHLRRPAAVAPAP